MSPRDEILDLMERRLGRVSLIAVPVPFLELTGDTDSALLLSQLLYWTDRARNDDGWVFKSRDDWHEELRLNRYRLDKARRRLRELGIVEESHHLVGARRVLHLRIRQTNLRTSLEALFSSRQAADPDEDDGFPLENRHGSAHESETPLPENSAVQGDSTRGSQPPVMSNTSPSRSDDSQFRSGGIQRLHVSEFSRPKCRIATHRTVELEPFERSKVDRSGLETTPETTSEIPAQTTAKTTPETAGEMEKERRKECTTLEQPGVHREADQPLSNLDEHRAHLDYRGLREMYRRQALGQIASVSSSNAYEDRLFEILGQMPGFPKERNRSQLDAILADFPGVDHIREFCRFRDYWRDAMLVRPWMALHAWMQRASGGALSGAKREPVRSFVWRTAPNGMCYTVSIARPSAGPREAGPVRETPQPCTRPADRRGAPGVGDSVRASPG